MEKYLNFLAPWWDNSDVYSTVSQRISVAHSGGLLFNMLFIGFPPFPLTVSYSINILFGITSQENYLHPNPWPKACFFRKPNVQQLITEVVLENRPTEWDSEIWSFSDQIKTPLLILIGIVIILACCSITIMGFQETLKVSRSSTCLSLRSYCLEACKGFTWGLSRWCLPSSTSAYTISHCF